MVKIGSMLVHEAKYAEAVEYCKEGMKQFPDDVVVKFRYYALTCEYLISESKRDTDEFKEALKQLKCCLSQTKGHPLWVKAHMKNGKKNNHSSASTYYYHLLMFNNKN